MNKRRWKTDRNSAQRIFEKSLNVTKPGGEDSVRDENQKILRNFAFCCDWLVIRVMKTNTGTWQATE